MKYLLLLAIAALGAPAAESPFACNRAALTPQARTRHFDVLGPALRARKKRIRELRDGFEFEFPPDAATFQLVSEWVVGERLCCPFFDIDACGARGRQLVAAPHRPRGSEAIHPVRF